MQILGPKWPPRDYRDAQTTAAHYYEQLFTFNQQQKQRRIERRDNPPPPNPESQTQTSQRTLLERTTLDPQAPPPYHRPAPAGLWEELAPDRVADNLRQGEFQAEATLVHDTTHYHAWSEVKVIDLPEGDETRKATEDSTVSEDQLSTEDNPKVVKPNGPRSPWGE